MSNAIWEFLSTTSVETPWLMVLICLGLLALPVILIPISKSTALARLGKRFPSLAVVAGIVSQAVLTLYYWTVGLASMLLLLATSLIHKDGIKSMLF